MGETLRYLLPKLYPDFLENEHWLIINHQGKSDLERSYPRKMTHWGEPRIRFIILRDNDGADCHVLKQSLIAKVPDNPPPNSMRIVCQELEGWLLGDMEAVAAAYPQATRHSNFKSLSKKDPDTFNNASELLKDLTGTGVKIERASRIAEKMRPLTNRSTSFQVFVKGLDRIITQ